MDIVIPFEVTPLSELPIIECTLFNGYHLSQHLQQTAEQLGHAVAEAGKPVYLLIDIRQVQLAWTELVSGLASIRDIRSHNQFPKSKGLLIVTTNDLLKIGAKALTQQQYASNGLVKVFETIEDALAFVQAEEAL